MISAYNGPLVVSFVDGEQYIINDGHAIYASLRNGRIWISNERGQIGLHERFTVRGFDSSAIVRLRPTSPQNEAEARNYEDLILMIADINRIKMINQIDEERYIAGVVEAEAGHGHTQEFYKAKAIICRTYLYGNIERHQNEGFHLCDEVHCQVYRGQSRNRNIQSAVESTRNIIITAINSSTPILAAYHSNCGGQTESSQNVWQSSLPYLITVIDPYCTSSPNARWQRTIPLNDWTAYMARNGLIINPNATADFSFQQPRRVLNYNVNNISIPVRQIRTDWQLRSTFFSITVEGGNVVLRGRGHGHGVGLCQEGAIEMGRRGFRHDEIINFYYQNVRLISITELDIKIPEFVNHVNQELK